MPGEIFPREVTSNVPRITMTGMELLHVEQHQGLIAYSPEEIIFRTSVGMLRVNGREMGFRLYTSGEAMVTGRIDSVCMTQKESRR